MSIRQLCRETARRPSNALLYFPEEHKTGIAPTRLFFEKELDWTVGMVVNVNWNGERAEAEILDLNGKFEYQDNFVFLLKTFLQLTSCNMFHWLLKSHLHDVLFFFVDDKEVLSQKDIAWSRENLPHSQEDHANAEDKENREPPKKKPRVCSKQVRTLIYLTSFSVNYEDAGRSRVFEMFLVMDGVK